MDWDKLRIFYAVAEAGSFTHAGDTLNLSQSAVSRQISTLEEIAADLDLTRERVRQIQIEALDQLRRAIKRGGVTRDTLL